MRAVDDNRSVGRTCGGSPIVTCEGTPQWLSVSAGRLMRLSIGASILSLPLPLSIYTYYYNACRNLQKSLEREKLLHCSLLFPFYHYSSQLNFTAKLSISLSSSSLSLLFHELKAWNELPPLLHRSNLTLSRYSLWLVVYLNQSRFTLCELLEKGFNETHGSLLWLLSAVSVLDSRSSYLNCADSLSVSVNVCFYFLYF